MFKNVASQKITLLAIDTAANTPKTGDAAQITAYASKDDGAVTVLADTTATELDATNAPGLYAFDLAQAETNADKLVFTAKSSTGGIRIVPVTVYTYPATGILAPTVSGRTLDVSAGGEAGLDWANVGTPGSTVNLSATTTNLVNTLTTYAGNTPQTGDSFARIGATGSGLTSLATQASVNTIDDFLDTEIAAILADTNELQTDWANGGRLDLLVDAILADTGTDGVALAAGSITAAVIGAGAIDADAIAADAVAEIWGTALTEAYRGTGSTGTGAQLLYELIAHMGESAIVSTTKTLKKLDGSTTAKTYTLDSATTPTSITETT